MKMVTIYLEYNILKEDVVLKGSLSKALDKLQKEGKTDIIVLSSPETEPEDIRKAFEHTAMSESFDYLKCLNDINKDIVYISKSIDDLIEWSKLLGKAILATKRPTSETDFNRICPDYEKEDEIYGKLKRFIHI